jgi:hypothetical protein
MDFWHWESLAMVEDAALGLSANLKTIRKVKQACQVEATNDNNLKIER